MKLEKIISGKILRHTFIPSLGMRVKRCYLNSDNTYELSVRYMSVKGLLEWGLADKLKMKYSDIISQFDILENPHEIKSFKDGKWVKLKTIFNKTKESKCT